jgi:hypothetical protein
MRRRNRSRRASGVVSTECAQECVCFNKVLIDVRPGVLARRQRVMRWDQIPTDQARVAQFEQCLPDRGQVGLDSVGNDLLVCEVPRALPEQE